MRICEDCGEAIPAERIAANPKTRLCVDCQGELERSGRFARHRMKHEIRFKAGSEEVESMEGVIVRGS